MFDVKVSVDTTAVSKMLGNLRKELPVALSRGIGNTLVLAQTDELNRMKDSFTIRRENFAKRSLKIQFAKPTNLVGTLSIADIAGRPTADIFSKFESGGNKIAQGGKIAIPTELVKPDVTKIISKGKRPRNLKNSFRTIINGMDVIATKAKAAKAAIKIAYILKSSVRIAPRLSFETTVTNSVNKNLYNEMEKVANRIIEKANQ